MQDGGSRVQSIKNEGMSWLSKQPYSSTRSNTLLLRLLLCSGAAARGHLSACWYGCACPSPLPCFQHHSHVIPCPCR